MDGTQLLDPVAGETSSRPASPDADPGIDLSRPVSPDRMEPEPETQTLAEIEAEGDEADLFRTDSGGTDSNTDSSRASTVSSARSSYLARSQELAREYVDDETKNGCSTCPPTCAATMTFTAHVVRAALPPLYLLELVVRWVRVRCSHGATPTSPKQKLVTVRRCAECLGWMYYFLLIWEVLIHSADFHARLKRLAGTSGVAHNATAELFFGVDPFEREPDHPLLILVDVDGHLHILPVLAHDLLHLLDDVARHCLGRPVFRLVKSRRSVSRNVRLHNRL